MHFAERAPRPSPRPLEPAIVIEFCRLQTIWTGSLYRQSGARAPCQFVQAKIRAANGAHAFGRTGCARIGRDGKPAVLTLSGGATVGILRLTEKSSSAFPKTCRSNAGNTGRNIEQLTGARSWIVNISEIRLPRVPSRQWSPRMGSLGKLVPGTGWEISVQW